MLTHVIRLADFGTLCGASGVIVWASTQPQSAAMDMSPAHHLQTAFDADPQETAEWLESFAAGVERLGPERARYLLTRLSSAARGAGLGWHDARNTPYVNTIRPRDEPQGVPRRCAGYSLCQFGQSTSAVVL